MRNFKKILAITLLVFSSTMLFAQQDTYANMYRYNMDVINPAYAGSEGETLLTSNVRSQWIGISDSPETQAFSLTFPVNGKIGLGISIINDELYTLRQTDLSVDFSYNLKTSEKTNLFLGLKAGGEFFNNDLLSLGIQGDDAFAENVGRFNPNIGVGAYFKGEKFYVNLSVPKLLKSLQYDKDGGSKATSTAHVYMGAGYLFNVNENITFTPSMMARMVSGAPMSFDLTGNFDFYEKFELGATYGLSEYISGTFIFKIVDWMHLGYSYEHSLSEINDFSDGTHEVLMRLTIGGKKK